MFTEQQLIERKGYLGASEVAAALGLSKFASKLELYMRKTAPPAPVDTDAMAFGRLVERHVLDRFENRVRPFVVLRPTENNPLEYASKTRLLRCHLDGLIKDTAVVEAKTARNRDGWGDPGTDAVPVDYLLQTQTQMILTGLPGAYVPVLFRDDLKLEQFEVTADAELAEMISEGVAEFWGHVERGEPPAPDFESRGALEIVKKIYSGTDGSILKSTPQQEAWYRALCDAQDKAAVCAKAAEGLKAMLLWDMQDAAELRLDDGKALRRKRVLRKGYSVESSEMLDARFVNVKEKS